MPDFAAEITELVEILDNAAQSRKRLDDAFRALRCHLTEARGRAAALDPREIVDVADSPARASLTEIERLRNGVARLAATCRDPGTARGLRALLDRGERL